MERTKLTVLSLFLLTVLLVGIPIEALSHFSYRLLVPLGLDVSMTPITFDMAFMTHSTGDLNYDKDLPFYTLTRKSKIEIPPNEMNLYRHKLPLLLFYELKRFKVESKESRHAICYQFSQFLSTTKIEAFMMAGPKRSQQRNSDGLGRVFLCGQKTY